MITANDLYGDRFILGLGVSHPPMVEGLRGHTYEKPIPAMRRYTQRICKGESGADSFPLAVAALGPLMLKLSGEMTRGHCLTTPILATRRRQRRSGPSKVVCDYRR